MHLFEFDQDSAQITKIVALTSQLKQSVEDGDIDPDNYTVDELLDYFQKYNVILDSTDLYNMVKLNPLKTVISDIQGDKVVFAGHDGNLSDEEADEKDDKTATVNAMAKKAMHRKQ